LGLSPDMNAPPECEFLPSILIAVFHDCNFFLKPPEHGS
jgi:hypothetical protein